MANLVLRSTSGGLLSQGDREDAERVVRLRPIDRPDLLVLAATPPHPDVPEDLDAWALNLVDCELGQDEARALVQGLRPVAENLAARIKAGRRVLVTCAMGLNRSGLVSGLTLRALGLPGEQAVRLVRQARGSQALSNHSFARLVRG